MSGLINKIFYLSLLGILFSFTVSIIRSFDNSDNNIAIEIQAEEDNEGEKETEENERGSEKEIESFFACELIIAINYSFNNTINLNFLKIKPSSGYSELFTPPPRFI